MIKTAMLIDCNDIDNFINYKVLKNYGIETITIFKDTEPALLHLSETDTRYELILLDAYFQQTDGFDFIRQFHSLNLHHAQGKVCFLSALLSPRDMMELFQKKIHYIQKPLTIESLANMPL